MCRSKVVSVSNDWDLRISWRMKSKRSELCWNQTSITKCKRLFGNFIYSNAIFSFIIKNVHRNLVSPSTIKTKVPRIADCRLVDIDLLGCLFDKNLIGQQHYKVSMCRSFTWNVIITTGLPGLSADACNHGCSKGVEVMKVQLGASPKPCVVVCVFWPE